MPPDVPVPVAIALGSNLGDRRAHLAFAVNELSHVLSNFTQSRWIETAPVGVSMEDPWFLNGAVVGYTTLTAHALLERLLTIEQADGRTRPFPGAPRTLDLDVVLYGNARIDVPGLVVPHPRFRERRFVLEPLAEIAGEWVDPVTGQTVSALLRSLAHPS